MKLAGYHKIRLEKHTCQLCQSNEIEDEIHFICRCNFLNVKQTALFNGMSETLDEFIHFNDTQKNIFLMKTKTAFKIHMGSILCNQKLT